MKNLLRLLLFLMSISIYAQQQIKEEDFLLLQRKTRQFFYENIDSSLYYIAKIETSNDNIKLAFAKGAKSFLKVIQGNTEEADALYVNALKLIENQPNTDFKYKNESLIYNYGGNIYQVKGDLPTALDCYLKAKDLAIKGKDILQVNMINQNIAIVHSAIGNYKAAITIYRESDKLIEEYKSLYYQEEYVFNKSKTYNSLGICYESYFSKNRNQKELLDSAFYYYKQSLQYSTNNFHLKLSSLKNIGNIYFYKGELEEAEKSYLAACTLAKENNDVQVFYGSLYNLGLINFDKKKYNLALYYFKRVDSLYQTQTTLGLPEFIDSNYKQAKIYDLREDSKNALKYAAIFSDNFEKMTDLQNHNLLEVNAKLSTIYTKEEISELKKKNELNILKRKLLYGSFVFVIVLLILLVVNKIRNKKKFKKKIASIINEYEMLHQKAIEKAAQKVNKQQTQSIHSDQEKEILENLEALIEKKFFLKPDFTQQIVAKKIKTNTAYLSSVVNKHYQQSFSSYLNELRINHVIHEILTNSKYRAYTTQAIAESVGFKNANSFTISFKKKTGVTPFQFINEIKKRQAHLHH